MIGQAEKLYALAKNKKAGAKRKTAMVSFISGKGGTGKSFLCLNTALALSEMGYKVLTVDLDPSFSNLSVMLDETPDFTIDDFLRGECDIADTVYMRKPELGFIFGGQGPFESEGTGRDVSRLLLNIQELAGSFDIVLLDNGSGIKASDEAVVSACSLNLVTITPEPVSVMDGYVLIKYFASKNITPEYGVIVNKCHNDEDAETAYTNLKEASSHFLGITPVFAGDLPLDDQIYRSVLDQKLFAEEYRETDTFLKLASISKYVAEYGQMANIIHPRTKTLSINHK